MKNIQEIVPGLENTGHSVEGVATAGQPEEEHFERLAKAGYKTVIDTRTAEEDHCHRKCSYWEPPCRHFPLLYPQRARHGPLAARFSRSNATQDC